MVGEGDATSMSLTSHEVESRHNEGRNESVSAGDDRYSTDESTY